MRRQFFQLDRDFVRSICLPRVVRATRPPLPATRREAWSCSLSARILHCSFRYRAPIRRAGRPTEQASRLCYPRQTATVRSIAPVTTGHLIGLARRS